MHKFEVGEESRNKKSNKKLGSSGLIIHFQLLEDNMARELTYPKKEKNTNSVTQSGGHWGFLIEFCREDLYWGFIIF